jgi:hypothetical protein
VVEILFAARIALGGGGGCPCACVRARTRRLTCPRWPNPNKPSWDSIQPVFAAFLEGKSFCYVGHSVKGGFWRYWRTYKAEADQGDEATAGIQKKSPPHQLPTPTAPETPRLAVRGSNCRFAYLAVSGKHLPQPLLPARPCGFFGVGGLRDCAFLLKVALDIDYFMLRGGYR